MKTPGLGLVSLLVFTATSAPALVHTWRGEVSGQWGRDENWGNGVPESDSALLFPPNGQNKNTYNSLLNLETGSIHLTGTGYLLAGLPCALSGSLSSTNATTNEISLTLRTPGIQQTHSQGRLIIRGALTLRTFSSAPIDREIYSAGFLELRGAVESRFRTVSPSGSIVWSLGTANLEFRGPGTVEMSGDAVNNYGATLVEGTTLLLNKTAGVAIPRSLTIGEYGWVTVGQPGQIANTSEVAIDPTGRLVIEADETIDGLTGAGHISIEAGARLTVGGAGNSSTFQGRITGQGGLTKAGTGAFTVDGTHSYFGSTIMESGILRANGNHGPSPWSLRGGILTGDGRLGQVSATAGTLAPGFDGVSARLRMSSLSLGPNSRLSWRQDPNGWSGLIVDGTVTLDNPPLEIIAHPYFAPTNGQVITLIDNRGTQPIKGAFTNLPPAGRLRLNDSVGRSYQLAYDGGDGNDVTLTYNGGPIQLDGGPTQAWKIIGGNGDQVLDPNECVHLTCLLTSTVAGTNQVAGITAELRSEAEGVFILQPHSPVSDLTSGGGSKSTLAFQVSTANTVPCNRDIPFQLILRSASHGASTIPFQLRTGSTPGTGSCDGCLPVIRDTILGILREPTHSGVMIPSGDADACATQNACPAVIEGNGIVRRYHLYSFTNRFVSLPENCSTLYLTSQSDERLMATVYRDTFNPNVLCTTNFLVATSRLAARSTEQCRFRWGYGRVIKVVVTEFDGTGNSAPYELRLAGAVCQPSLTIERLSEDRVKLSWPTKSASFGLEMLPNLGGPSEWLGLAGHVSNGRFVSTNQVTGDADRYFRLALPWP